MARAGRLQARGWRLGGFGFWILGFAYAKPLVYAHNSHLMHIQYHTLDIHRLPRIKNAVWEGKNKEARRGPKARAALHPLRGSRRSYGPSPKARAALGCHGTLAPMEPSSGAHKTGHASPLRLHTSSLSLLHSRLQCRLCPLIPAYIYKDQKYKTKLARRQKPVKLVQIRTSSKKPKNYRYYRATTRAHDPLGKR